MGGSRTRTGGWLPAGVIVLICGSILFAISGIVTASIHANMWLCVGLFLTSFALCIGAMLVLVGGVIIVLYSWGTDEFCYNLCTV